MFILIVGCGRAGSALAKEALAGGHTVSVLDEDPESVVLLDEGLPGGWEGAGGRYTVGVGLEVEALVTAGIEQADAFVATTDGDNTNIVIAQIAQRRFDCPRVVARVLDPRRATWYEQRGMATICPTKAGIEMLRSAVFGTGDEEAEE